MPTMRACGKCQNVGTALRSKIAAIEFSNSEFAIQRIICEINKSAFNVQITGEYFILTLLFGQLIICIWQEQVDFFYLILINNSRLVPQISSFAIFKISS